MLKVFPVMSSLFEESEPVGKIKDLKESLLQEIMLVKRCKNIELVKKDKDSSS